MATRHTRGLWYVCLTMAILATGTDAHALESTWICGDGNYSSLECWSPRRAVLPCNFGPITFDVVIPMNGSTITMDLEHCEVNFLDLGALVTFRVPLGNTYAVVGHADIAGIVDANGGDFRAPEAEFDGGRAQVHASDGAYVEIGARSYSATGLRGTYTLLSAEDEGTILNLSKLQEIDDGFSFGAGIQTHTIKATNRGTINLAELLRIVGPAGNDVLVIEADNAGIGMPSLQTISSGTVNTVISNRGRVVVGDLVIEGVAKFDLREGATLEGKSIRSDKPATVRLADNQSCLKITGDLDVGKTNIDIINPNHGWLKLGGDFTHGYTDETKVPFDYSPISLCGNGPQEVELAGWDAGIYTEVIPLDWNGTIWNFGFGTMEIGEPNAPTVVFLVDYRDNRNKPGVFGQENEALYLFGTADDPCGLHINDGSILYMGGLNVYLTTDGTPDHVEPLSERFAPGQSMIPFDQGWLCRTWPQADDPQNRIRNGGFETGVNPPIAPNPAVPLPAGSDAMDGWGVDVNAVNWMHESYVIDSDYHNGERFADLASGAVSQTFDTVPGELYHVWFDVAPCPFADEGQRVAPRIVTVSAADSSETFTCDPSRIGPDPGADNAWSVEWQKKTWRFVATDETTTLTFAGADGTLGQVGAMIDNIIVLGEPGEPNVCSLTLSSTPGGSVTVPGEGTFAYTCGEVVCLEAQADPGYRFVRWEATGGCSLDPNEAAPVACVTIEGHCALKAVFERLCALTLSVIGQGTIDPPLDTYYVPCGDTRRVAATPGAGHRFVRWEGTAWDQGKVTVIEQDDSGSTAEVLVDGVYTLTAVFEPLLGLTLGVIGRGSTDPEPGTYFIPSAETVCFTAIPDSGFRFCRWEGTCLDAAAIADANTICVTVEGTCTLTAVFQEVVYDRTMDADPGWTLEGQWEYGKPTGQRCGGWGNNDPNSGHTGPNVIGVNLNGCYDPNVGGPYYATTKAFDLSQYQNVRLRFWRWLNCDIPEYVKSTVEVSTDKVNWTVLWTQGERQEITDVKWTLCEYPLTQADCQATVYVRWGYHVLKERAYAYTGWNIDDVQLIGCRGCDQ